MRKLSMGNALSLCMPLAISSTKPANRESRPAPTFTPEFGSAYSVAEINAYIAIRDQLLDEAEKVHTTAKLASTALANDFVDGCLKPGRTPYEAQCLSEWTQSESASGAKSCAIELQSFATAPVNPCPTTSRRKWSNFHPC